MTSIYESQTIDETENEIVESDSSKNTRITSNQVHFSDGKKRRNKLQKLRNLSKYRLTSYTSKVQ